MGLAVKNWVFRKRTSSGKRALAKSTTALKN